MSLPIEHPVVLIRKYRSVGGWLKSFPQCKVVNVNGEWVAYRDIYRNKSQMFRDNSWNIDHVVLDWLEKHGVDKIYYNDTTHKNLYQTTIKRVQNALDRGDAKKEQLNSHTQVFVLRQLFSLSSGEEESNTLRAGKTWVSREYEIDVARTENKPIESPHIVEDLTIPDSVRMRLRDRFNQLQQLSASPAYTS